jgi:endonuclease/exonuclease/phosphatase family metal-dependent hydrolase
VQPCALVHRHGDLERLTGERAVLRVNAAAYQRKAGFRMDFLLLSPALASRLVRAEVDGEQRGRDRPSDHAPVWIELDAAGSIRPAA